MPIFQDKVRARRILHCNLLLPRDHLPPEVLLKPAKEKRQSTSPNSRDKGQNSETDNDDSNDDDYGYYMPRHQTLPQLQINTDEEYNDREVTQPSQDAELEQ